MGSFMSSLKNKNLCPLDLAILQETQVAPVALPDPSFPPSPLTFHHLLQESSSYCYKQTKKSQLLLKRIVYAYYTEIAAIYIKFSRHEKVHRVSIFMALKYKQSARFSSTYTKIGTIQRRLAWPLSKDDTQIHEASHIFTNVCIWNLERW